MKTKHAKSPVGYWTTRGYHRRLCVLSFRSFGGICETASCPVRELSILPEGGIRELSSPRLVQCASCPVTINSTNPCNAKHGAYKMPRTRRDVFGCQQDCLTSVQSNLT